MDDRPERALTPAPAATPHLAVRVPVERLANVALAAIAAALLARVAAEPAAYQWDFRVYHAAARAAAAGLDPYDTAALSAAAGAPVALPFVYPPGVLLALRPLAWLPLAAAYYLYLALKVGALVALARVWHLWLPRDLRGPALWAFCLLAYNGTLYGDVASGNVTVFEQLALWTGLLALRRGRPAVFCAGVFAASVCKLTPLCFLALLAVAPAVTPRRAARLATATLLAAAAPHALALALAPALERGWIARLGFATARGVGADVNPSLLGLLDTVRGMAARGAGVALPPAAASVAFALLAGGVLAAGVARARAARFADEDGRHTQLVALAALVYALASPRAAVYSYVVALVPSYVVLRTASLRAARAAALLFVLASFSTADHPATALPVLRSVCRIALAYLPVALAATFVWVQLVALGARAVTAGVEAARPHPRAVRAA